MANLFEDQAKLEALARRLAEQASRDKWARLRSEEERERMEREADEQATRAAHSYTGEE